MLETMKVFLNESRSLNDKFKDLFKYMSDDLRYKVLSLKKRQQRKDKHPEGNVLKHTIIVYNRTLKFNDIDISLSALFHDIGKDETEGVHKKHGHITHFGHEKVSAQLVLYNADFIEKLGGNVDAIHFIVINHMRIKNIDEMRPKKQKLLKSHKYFNKLLKFASCDKGGF